jgi:hypothetical protein
VWLSLGRGAGALPVTRLPLRDLVLVAGHAAFKANLNAVPSDAESDRWWVLQNFQLGEPPFYLEHIRRGVVLAANNPVALLLFSGGLTRQEAGPWSESRTYHEIAKSRLFWIPDNMSDTRDDVARRTDIEEFARDSFENLLFGICRFQQVVGSYPRLVTLVSWAFKAARFDLHRAALRFPASRFRFIGVNEPVDLDGALRGERGALRSFIDYPFGTGGDLADKRAGRTFGPRHQYHKCPGLLELFRFMDDQRNAQTNYRNSLPWEEDSA